MALGSWIGVENERFGTQKNPTRPLGKDEEDELGWERRSSATCLGKAVVEAEVGVMGRPLFGH